MVKVSAESSSIAVHNAGDGTVNINVAAQLAQLPSLLTPLLLQIVQYHKPRFDINILLEKSPEIEEKLAFNKLSYYSEDVRRNCEFMAIVEESLAIVDDEEPGAKATIQWTINKAYREIKRQLLMENKVNASNKEHVQKVISDNSDTIFQDVSEQLFCVDTIGVSCAKENLMAAKELLACYGFIGCMILENPSNDQ